MSKSTFLTARIEPGLKTQASQVLAKVGLSTTDAITMFLCQVVLHGGLPFDVKVPDSATEGAGRAFRGAGRAAKKKSWRTPHEGLFALSTRSPSRSLRSIGS